MSWNSIPPHSCVDSMFCHPTSFFLLFRYCFDPLLLVFCCHHFLVLHNSQLVCVHKSAPKPAPKFAYSTMLLHLTYLGQASFAYSLLLSSSRSLSLIIFQFGCCQTNFVVPSSHCSNLTDEPGWCNHIAT